MWGDKTGASTLHTLLPEHVLVMSSVEYDRFFEQTKCNIWVTRGLHKAL